MYDRENDIERIFYEDSREKKRVAVGIHNRASRLGYIRGGMRTPVDYLKGKAKKDYMKVGIIVEYNIYDEIKNIPSMEEIKAMDYDKAKGILGYIKKKHTMPELAKHFGCSKTSLYDHFWYAYDLAIPRNSKLNSNHKIVDKNKKRKGKEIVTSNENVPVYTNTTLQANVIAAPQKIQPQPDILVELMKKVEELSTRQANIIELVEPKGFKTRLCGEFVADEAETRIMSLLQTMIKDNRYKITFEIEEQL